MKYELKDLITFSTIAKLKSFSKTAKTLETSKSNITKRINELESDLKMNLIYRTTRDVNLTDSGKKFLKYCNNILEATNNLDDFIDSSSELSGNLKIALPPYYSRHNVVPYLKDFLEKYPNLKLNITLDEDPINIIEKGYDLQVRIQIPDDENLNVTKLSKNSKVLCASPKYLKEKGTPKTPEELANHNCIVFAENQLWQFKKKNGKKITNFEPNGNIKCNNGEIIKELILSGAGLTIKSDCDIKDEIKSKKIIVLLDEYEVINKTEFYAVFSKSRNESPKIKAFIDFFKSQK